MLLLAHQLLLDVYNLKSVMLKLPLLVLESTPPLNAMRDLDQAANTSSYTIPLSYTKFVTVQLSKIEMVLKLVGTPTAMLVERFCIMWPDGGEEDFQVFGGLCINCALLFSHLIVYFSHDNYFCLPPVYHEYERDEKR